MNLLSHLHRKISLLASVMLLSVSTVSYADDMQEADRLYKQGQPAQALERVNKVLASKPSDPQARFLKGVILTGQGKADSAIAVFTALTEDYPELPEPYNNLAVLYAERNDYEKAKVALEMAIRTHPSYATAHENLGDIYAKMASKAYDRALQLDRSNTATQTKLAMIQDLFAANPSRAARSSASSSSSSSSKTYSSKSSKRSSRSGATEDDPGAGGARQDSMDANSSEVFSAVQDWAAAWSSKDVNRYLSFYAPDFKTPGGEGRSEWESIRSDRIKRPKSISVAVSRPNVKFSDANHATITFKQTYNASHLKSSGSKTLEMVKSDGKWLILEEISR